MLGLRGAARYVSALFRPAFELECRALKKGRETLGFSNVEVMMPFVRTVDEAVWCGIEESPCRSSETEIRGQEAKVSTLTYTLFVRDPAGSYAGNFGLIC